MKLGGPRTWELGYCWQSGIGVASRNGGTPGSAFEVDGGYHARRRTADARRDRVLRRMGYRLLRLEAELVEHHIEIAVARVRDALG